MLEELAERVEKLDGPDREVDGKIMCAIGSAQKRGNTLFRMHPEAGSTDVLVYTPTPYTASLDAAMTLVPEDNDAIHGWDYPARSIRKIHYDDGELVYEGRAKSPALALCAAALRALAASEAGDPTSGPG